MRTALTCLQFQGWLTYTCVDRVGSIVLPCQSAEPAFLSVAAGEGQGWVSNTMTTGPARPTPSGIDGWEKATFPCPYFSKTDQK